ncbi:MAG TPA: hypothetical protein VE985_09505 [Gaiellaceae bacterium]|nr:hypothetical protein [Gaiellaceae bacterium]
MTKCLGLLGLVSTLALTACAGGRSAAPRLSPARARQAPPPPTRRVGTHGIEVAVPARWRLGRGMCGTPKANTVLWNEDGTLQCLIRQPPGLSVVEFGSILRKPCGWYRHHAKLVRIDGGARARRWVVGTVDGSHAVQLVFAARGISITVLSPHRPLLRRILASVRTVRVDPNGCPTHPSQDYRRGQRPSGSPPFVPKGAVGMVGCSYKGRWLDMSNRIGGRAAERLARAFAAAPSGFSHARPGAVLPSSCLPSWRASLIVARFEYSGGRRPATVTAHLSGCTRLGASNGRWAVRLRPAWVMRLVSDARYAGDFIEYGE